MDALYRMVTNPIFLSAFFSWFLAQVLKSIVEIFRDRPATARRIIRRLFWATGGMPSSHTAVVAALATSIGFCIGIDSPVFILSLFLAFLTVRDSLGVRRAAGSQAIVLNQLLYELSKRFKTKERAVEEIHGHKFSEVTVGALLGFFLAVAFCRL